MHTVIIGNGISGITAARWIRKLSDNKITVISSESPYFYSRTALMYIYMGHMEQQHTQPYENWFWEKNRIDLLQDHVKQIDFDNKSIQLEANSAMQYDKLIIAVGSKSNKFGWPGQDLDGVGGLYNIQDLEYMERYSADLNRAVIVGGGLIGIEMAEMFHSRNIPVTMLVREQQYWDNVLPSEEATMISNHIRAHHIDLKLGVHLAAINDDGNGRVKSVSVKETEEEIVCGFVGLTAGVSPNIDFLKSSILKTNRGIVVDDYLQSNIPDVYAIGDCAEINAPVQGRKSIEAVWYTGRIMGETVAYNICGQAVKYDPGMWFNSAKFFDIEYQVYGNVLPQMTGDMESLFWKHKDNTKSVRIVFDGGSRQVVGFNLLGIRFRHEVCEKWIAGGFHIEEVLRNLDLADFNPEFHKSYSHAVCEQYNQKYGKTIEVESKRSLNKVLSFLKS